MLIRFCLFASIVFFTGACAPNPVSLPADGAAARAEQPAPSGADEAQVEDGELQSPASFETYMPWDPARDGVETTPSGLQYIVVSRGPAGGARPSATDFVSVHYEGRRTTGETFDSSYARGMPAEFRLDQVIPGWTEGVQLMREGDEFLFFIPNALAYGDRDVGPVIRAGDDLLFHVALLEVSQPPSADAEAWNTYFPWKSDHPDVRRTGSGLEYVILESGPAEIAPPRPEEFVAVNFEARLAESGEIVGSTFEMGQPEVFPAGAVIPGWSEALSLMRPGDRWMLFLPAALAFGDEGGGPIPPGSDIVFEYELLDIMR